jgi:hypothetical protein
VDIREVETEDDAGAQENLLLLRAGADEVAASTFDDVRDELLLVNSDLYVTGTRGIDDIETPDALARLDELPFSVEGYPVSKGKLLLIEMSRYIEARAWETEMGRLHSGFQHLSRIDDERGTRQVYERLADTGVEVHVYGVPDVETDLDLAVHGHDSEELRTTWFVVYEHPTDPSEHAALVAVLEDGRWDGFWTYRPGVVSEVATYLTDTY